MTPHTTRRTSDNRLKGLLRRSRTRPRRSSAPPAGSGPATPPRAADPDGAAHDPAEWADGPDSTPGWAGAEYRYRLGVHQLGLSARGLSQAERAAVARATARFALVVEGPLLVLGARFGAAGPWSWAAPYNWHFTPAAERVVPAALDLTPATFTRLWATLWITLVDPDTARVLVRRAVTLHPEFTHALHATLRTQALQPFSGAAAARALGRLRSALGPAFLRARATAQCAAIGGAGGPWTPTPSERLDPSPGILMEQPDGSRSTHFNRRHPRLLDAHPLHPGLPSPGPGDPRGRPVAQGSDS